MGLEDDDDEEEEESGVGGDGDGVLVLGVAGDGVEVLVGENGGKDDVGGDGGCRMQHPHGFPRDKVGMAAVLQKNHAEGGTHRSDVEVRVADRQQVHASPQRAVSLRLRKMEEFPTLEVFQVGRVFLQSR